MKTNSCMLAPLLEGFFVERLMTQKCVSQETISAYRDTFRLLLKYGRERIGKSPAVLNINDLDAPFICNFLNHLEQDRDNTPRTRNYRLAAIRSFFRYVSYREPQLSGHIQQVLAIPSKRWQKGLIDFLSIKEVNAILEAVDRKAWTGRRDYALFSLAVQTGLRVSELIHLCCDDIFLEASAYVRCHGKGRKDRCVPIRKSIITVMKAWLREHSKGPSAPLFPSSRGVKLSRDGVQYILDKHVAAAQYNCPSLSKKRVTPHVLRHTAAVHLLQSGVGLSVIALWLGHESIESTQIYVDSDLEYKRRILEKTIDLKMKPLIFYPDDKLMAFLQSL
jgi:integrase/recombinase XerD